MTDKKQWVDPELIVLVRNMPEEAVLGACKIPALNASYGNNIFGCDSSGCNPCVEVVAS
jgi:hypothetical protein